MPAFLQANIVVQAMTVGLLIAAVMTIAIAGGKCWLLRKLNKMADGFEDRFWSGGSLDDLFDREAASPAHPMASVFAAAIGEWRRSAQVAGADVARGAALERVNHAMNTAVCREMDQLQRWMPLLPCVGITAPLCGLAGTIWALTSMQGTDVALEVVRALPATGAGLGAAVLAIPAYLSISAASTRFAHRLEDFGAELSTILSRQGEPAT